MQQPSRCGKIFSTAHNFKWIRSKSDSEPETPTAQLHWVHEKRSHNVASEHKIPRSMAPLSNRRSLSLLLECHSQGLPLMLRFLAGSSRCEADTQLLPPSSAVSKQDSDFKCSVAKALALQYSQNVGFWASESSSIWRAISCQARKCSQISSLGFSPQLASAAEIAHNLSTLDFLGFAS